MDLAHRTRQLISLFSYEKKVYIPDTHMDIIPFHFTQSDLMNEIIAYQKELPVNDFHPITDDCIDENSHFNYVVFTPQRRGRSEACIVLLHGLNERSWDKYLPWAEFLCKETGKPVILFPIAFHMNRSPSSWFNPRALLPWLNKRKESIDNLDNATFVNLALSSRLSGKPLRFYVSGKESVYNLCQLTHEIKTGQHPLFKAGASVNLFAYSIGALLSQVVLLANPWKLFSDTKLFMFCGGGIFNEMNGNARDIMDNDAYNRMMHYFIADFIEHQSLPCAFKNDMIDQAFKMMICADVMQEERESFFQKASNRIKAFSLKKDVVMPTYGIIHALGRSSEKILKELDFPFSYTHQNPFPDKVSEPLLSESFIAIFNPAAHFL